MVVKVANDILAIEKFKKAITKMDPEDIARIKPEMIPENIPASFINNLPAQHRKKVEELVFSRNIHMLQVRQKIKTELGKETISALDTARRLSVNGSIKQLKNRLIGLKDIKQKKLNKLSNILIAKKQLEFAMINEGLVTEVRQEYAEASVALHTLKGKLQGNNSFTQSVFPAIEKLRKHGKIAYQLIGLFFLERLQASHYIMAKKVATFEEQDINLSKASERIDDLNKSLRNSQSRMKRAFRKNQATIEREAIQKQISHLSAQIKAYEVPLSDTDLTLWLDAIVDYSLYKNTQLRGHMILNKAKNNLLQLLLRYCHIQENTAKHVANNPFLRISPEKVIHFTLKSEQFVLDYFKAKRIEVTTMLSLTANEKADELEKLEKEIISLLKNSKHLR